MSGARLGDENKKVPINDRDFSDPLRTTAIS